MLTLLLVGLASGIVTGLSPCVLPVLPGVLATSALPSDPAASSSAPAAAPDRRRPFLVIAGLVTAFAVLTLLGGALLSALGLPADLVRNVGIALLVVVGLGLLIPGLGRLLERPFVAASRFSPRRGGSAFAFGAAFGVVFVPCAGPVLAVIVALAATTTVPFGLVVLTLAFSVGVAIPLLMLAVAGQRLTERLAAVRSRLPLLRRVSGAVLVATGVAIAFGVTEQAQRLVPDYAAAAQRSIEDSEIARDALAALDGSPVKGDPRPSDAELASSVDDLGPVMTFDECERDPSRLANCGPIRPFVGISTWLNTADGREVSADDLRGKVVLVDFWTFGCINCQRTLPYLTSWDAAYRDDGLVVVGIHSPEFAYEHEVDNVIEAAADLGVEYPIGLDNDFRTWRAYDQRYWPAQYLVDRNGVVRQVHYGEGAYDDTERLIQQLLRQTPANPPLDGERSAAAG